MTAALVEVRVRPAYQVRVGPGLLGEASNELVEGRSVAVVADARVAQLHGARLGGLGEKPRFDVPAGEGSKNFAMLERVLEFLAGARLDRSSLVVTFGGGMVSDLGGLAASLFMRGVDVAHLPTTLLAQVDASLGGKTGINLPAGKNLAGTFHQPCAVLADTELLATLDEEEFRSGLGEVAKSALLGSPGLFERLEQGAAAILARDPEALQGVVVDCVRLKAEVVAEDEHEGGRRKLLNLGHTFGHAIEHAAGYGVVPHGVAVAVGLGLAARASSELGLLEDPDLPARTERLLRGLGLPASLADLRRETSLPLAAGDLVAAMRSDKKARDAEPALVLPRAVGRLELDVRPGLRFLEQLCE